MFMLTKVYILITKIYSKFAKHSDTGKSEVIFHDYSARKLIPIKKRGDIRELSPTDNPFGND